MAKTKRIPTSLVVVLICLFIGLGAWQLFRLDWKNNMTAMAEAHYSQEPLLIDSVADIPDKIPLFHHVVVRGVARHDAALTVIGRYVDKTMGRHILTPFELADGGYVLVNQGWVAEGFERPSVAQKQEIEGVIVPNGAAPAWFLPRHNPAKNEWINEDITAMVAHLGKQSLVVQPLLIQQTASAVDFPQVQKFELRFWNQHKEYAIMWFAIALVTTVMQIFYWRSKKT